MTTPLSQPPQELGFFGRFVERIYHSRMEKAARVVELHLRFLSIPTTIKPRPSITNSAAHVLFAPTSREAKAGCATISEDKVDLAMSVIPRERTAELSQ
jgi:hypothetical protein